MNYLYLGLGIVAAFFLVVLLLAFFDGIGTTNTLFRSERNRYRRP